jgi:hypothetical protein
MKALAGLVSFVALVSSAEACRCDLNSASFERLAKNGTLVVRGIVESRAASKGSIDVKVSRVLRGALERPAEPIRVWGDDGKLCRPYVSRFPPGTEWLFVLENRSFGGFPQQPGARDYWISICGAYWVRVEGDRVQGRIRDAKANETMTVDELLKLLGKS